MKKQLRCTYNNSSGDSMRFKPKNMNLFHWHRVATIGISICCNFHRAHRSDYFLKSPRINEEELSVTVKQIRDVMATPQKMFINYIRTVMRSGEISPPYPFEGEDDSDSVLSLAYQRLQELLARPVEHIDPETTSKIFKEIPGLLPRLNVYKEERKP